MEENNPIDKYFFEYEDRLKEVCKPDYIAEDLKKLKEILQHMFSRCLQAEEQISGNERKQLQGRSDLLALANANAAILLADADEKNKALIGITKQFEEKKRLMDEQSRNLAKANVSAAFLVAEIETKNTELKQINDELKSTQAQLVHSHKMAAMGQLGAGLAHELNQPLCAIKGYAQMMISSVPPDDQNRELLEEIVTQTNRMNKIINSIRSYARTAGNEYKPMDLNKCIEDAFMLFESQLREKNIKTSFELGEQLPQIKGDLNQLQQVFMNLISNSMDAMVSSGAQEKQVKVKTVFLNEDNAVEVIFSDNGVGIPQEIVSEIFNPFFTTKPQGSGAGLGLSIASGIVKTHMGEIGVVSEPGKFTDFHIIFPTVSSEKSSRVGETKEPIVKYNLGTLGEG